MSESVEIPAAKPIEAVKNVFCDAARGRLWLIPSPLTDVKQELLIRPEQVLTADDIERVRSMRYFVVENGKRARAWLKVLGLSPSQLHIHVLSEVSERLKTSSNADPSELKIAIRQYLEPLWQGHDVGFLSDAGCPCVADPGAEWVRVAHESGLEVCPMIGPSSLLMALMASGLNGQCFGFFGYVPSTDPDRRTRLLALEQLSKQWQQSIQVIETPYRNSALFEALINTLRPDTRLSIAFDLTGEHEWIRTHRVAQWRDFWKSESRSAQIEQNQKTPLQVLKTFKRPMICSFLAPA